MTREAPTRALLQWFRGDLGVMSGWNNPYGDGWNSSNNEYNLKAYVPFIYSNPDDAGLLPSLSQFLSAYSGTTSSSQDMTSAINSTWGLADVTQAQERLDALLSHLQDHADYYRYMIYQEIADNQMYNPVSTLGASVSQLLEPRCVGYQGSQLAFPVNTVVANAITGPLITGNPDIQNVSVTDPVILPTTALAAEARLGACGGCEPFIEQSRAIDLSLRSAEADQAEEEAKRYAARLAASPPLLGDPRHQDDAVLRIQIVNPSPSDAST
jgi:hypothetical protein